MLVRVFGLLAILVGALLWGGREPLLGAHIGVGMLVALALFVMGVMALLKKAIGPGVAGIVMAVLLPAFGFMQLPLTFHSWRPVQVIHVMVALMAIGLGERLYSALHR
jgi:hypothetical protein